MVAGACPTVSTLDSHIRTTWDKLKAKVEKKEEATPNAKDISNSSKEEEKNQKPQISLSLSEEEVKTLSFDKFKERMTQEVTHTFDKDEQGYFLAERHIKGVLKEAGEVLRLKNSRNMVNLGVNIKPDKLYLGATQPTDTLEANVFFEGMRGEKFESGTSIKVYELVKPQKPLVFTLKIVNSPYTADLRNNIAQVLEVAGNIGLGGARRIGVGKFEVIRCEK